ncbi:MAG: hypothetical protein K8R18_07395 [Parvibaculum sp.]|uniref:MFS domain-containing histidine kinase n=1 Tax=Parvibaculum sp. TaxID=2024848 RepID=UPI0025D17B54|nr:MFS domain-containing histidine kinase [Parvibaculum sp.]MCE9649432.1 hypothetical protein [Parvibaculum sp.]
MQRNFLTEAGVEDEPQDSVGSELDAIFLESVFPVAMYLTGLFALFSVLHIVLLPRSISLDMTMIAALSGIISTAIGYAARRGKIPVRRAYVAGFALFALGLSNSAIHMWLIQDIDQSTNFALTLVAVGLFFLSRRYLGIAYAITFAIWACLALSITDGEGEFAHFAIMNLQAAVIGFLAHFLRLRVNRRLIRMRSEANVREEKLAEALMQAQLYAAAERENKAKTEFLANMSHELRTPLNAILGFSEIMTQQIFGPHGSPKYAEYAGNIHDAGRHLLSLVNDILDLSRIQIDEKSLHVQPVDLKSVCENCLSIIRERAERGSVHLTLQAPGFIPAIETDERRLKQIVINLLSNAVKFTPANGRVTLTIETTGDGKIALRVSDTGIGMSAEELSQAATPFWQAQGGLARNFDGTGLGLALVVELLKVMNGTFALESTPGAGTVASVTLPQALPNSEAVAAA